MQESRWYPAMKRVPLVHARRKEKVASVTACSTVTVAPLEDAQLGVDRSKTLLKGPTIVYKGGKKFACFALLCLTLLWTLVSFFGLNGSSGSFVVVILSRIRRRVAPQKTRG